MEYAPNSREIRDVARKAVAVLAASGLVCCLFGSAGCALYGNSRTPNDVDIVVFTYQLSTEALKELLVKQASTSFYLRPAKTPGATYKVLFANLAPRGHRKRSCKVDVLVPGTLNIPFVPTQHIVRSEGLPVMPLIVLLLLKLQGWEDHRLSGRSDMQQKQYVDVRDIQQLLQIAAQKGETVSQMTWLPRDFVDAGQERLIRFLGVLRPTSSHLWEIIGFTTDDYLEAL